MTEDKAVISMHVDVEEARAHLTRSGWAFLEVGHRKSRSCLTLRAGKRQSRGPEGLEGLGEGTSKQQSERWRFDVVCTCHKMETGLRLLGTRAQKGRESHLRDPQPESDLAKVAPAKQNNCLFVLVGSPVRMAVDGSPFFGLFRASYWE